MRVLIFLLAIILAGCETTKLWQEQPEQFVKVIPASQEEDVEVALKQAGREYFCQNLYDSTYRNNKVCYARLTREDKVRQIQVKLLKTPEAIAIDAVHTIQVVGYIALNSLFSYGYHKG